MDLLYVMDTMFDLLNESDNLNVQQIEENEAEGLFNLTAYDGTRIRIHCSISEE